MLGLFLRAASESSYQQLLVRRVLGDEPVERVMRTDVRMVSPSISIQELAENHIYQHHFNMFPVTEDGHLVCCEVQPATRTVRHKPIARYQRLIPSSPCFRSPVPPKNIMGGPPRKKADTTHCPRPARPALRLRGQPGETVRPRAVGPFTSTGRAYSMPTSKPPVITRAVKQWIRSNWEMADKPWHAKECRSREEPIDELSGSALPGPG